jgi:predicted GNAT family N-acyltransferase
MLGAMNNIEYGVAEIDDLPRIVEMKMAMFLEAGHGDLLAKNASTIVLEDYKRLYENKVASHFVARSNGEIVASVGVFIKSDLPFRYYSSPTYGFIGDVYVVKNYRQNGMAMRLSEDALAWLRLNEVKTVRLLASEGARPIYEKLGFMASDEMVLDLAT